MDYPIDNLRRLIDSGTPQNLEMAVQLTTNCADEFQWLHRYCVAKTKLPTRFASWYALYAEVSRYCHDRVLIPKEYYVTEISNAPFNLNAHEFRMSEIHENVANELHYMMFSEQAHEMLRDIETTSYALQYHYGRDIEEAKRNRAIVLSNKLLRLIRFW